MVLKGMIKNVFSNLPYGVQRFLILPYAFIVNKEDRRIDNCLLKKVVIDESLDSSFIKFKKLINYAYEHVPYYRNTWKSIGITPQDIKLNSDIAKLPIIDKQTVKEYYNEFVSDEVNINDLIEHPSGGSSGINLTILYDDNTVRARRLGILRWLNFAGLNSRDKGVWLGRAHKTLFQDKIKWGERGEKFFGYYNPVSNRLQLATNNMTPDVLEHYVSNIKKFKPAYIQGYPASIAALARYMDTKYDCYQMKAVLTSSEVLTASDRKVIEKVFRCKVFDRYGLGEEVASAIECECHDGYHIEIDRCYVEVTDECGNIVEDHIGDIVGTNLENYAFPLIRYKTGDLGSIKYEGCACGRKLPIISELIGRGSEYLVDKYYVNQTEGPVSQSIVIPDGVLAYQIEQIKIDDFVVRFCSNSTTDLSMQIMIAVKKYVEEQLHIDNPKIKVLQCRNIPVSANGKMKYLISHVQ